MPLFTGYLFRWVGSCPLEHHRILNGPGTRIPLDLIHISQLKYGDDGKLDETELRFCTAAPGDRHLIDDLNGILIPGSI